MRGEKEIFTHTVLSHPSETGFVGQLLSIISTILVRSLVLCILRDGSLVLSIPCSVFYQHTAPDVMSTQRDHGNQRFKAELAAIVAADCSPVGRLIPHLFIHDGELSQASSLEAIGNQNSNTVTTVNLKINKGTSMFSWKMLESDSETLSEAHSRRTAADRAPPYLL